MRDPDTLVWTNAGPNSPRLTTGTSRLPIRPGGRDTVTTGAAYRDNRSESSSSHVRGSTLDGSRDSGSGRHGDNARPRSPMDDRFTVINCITHLQRVKLDKKSTPLGDALDPIIRSLETVLANFNPRTGRYEPSKTATGTVPSKAATATGTVASGAVASLTPAAAPTQPPQLAPTLQVQQHAAPPQQAQALAAKKRAQKKPRKAVTNPAQAPQSSQVSEDSEASQVFLTRMPGSSAAGAAMPRQHDGSNLRQGSSTNTPPVPPGPVPQADVTRDAEGGSATLSGMFDHIRQGAPSTAALRRAGLDGPLRTRPTTTVAPAKQKKQIKQGLTQLELVHSASAGPVLLPAAPESCCVEDETGPMEMTTRSGLKRARPGLGQAALQLGASTPGSVSTDNRASPAWLGGAPESTPDDDVAEPLGAPI